MYYTDTTTVKWDRLPGIVSTPFGTPTHFDDSYIDRDVWGQVQFHVATAMPSLARDPHCNEKRKYIGNDYVSIVYNDSGQDFNIHTIKVSSVISISAFSRFWQSRRLQDRKIYFFMHNNISIK